MVDYSRFDELVNGAELAKSVKEIEKNNGVSSEFPQVPDGKYEVSLAKAELKETKKDKLPLVSLKFKILKGEFKGKHVWANFNVVYDFVMHRCHEFLRQMEPETIIHFNGRWKDYAEMFNDLTEELAGKIGFVLSISEDDKGFKVYEIEDIWTL